MKLEGPLESIPAIVFEANYLSPAVQEAQKKAEIKNAALRHAERMAVYEAWVKPEAIAERQERHAKEAADALARTKEALGITGEEEPLPDPKTLPKEIVGQAPSTIRAWLRHQQREPPMTPVTHDTCHVCHTPPAAPAPRWWQKLASWLGW